MAGRADALHALWGLARRRPTAARVHRQSRSDDAAPEVRGEAARLLVAAAGRGEATRRDELAGPGDEGPVAVCSDASDPATAEQGSLKDIVPVLADADPYLVGAALDVLGRPGNHVCSSPAVESKNATLAPGRPPGAAPRPVKRMGRKQLPKFLADPDPAVRRAAVQWVGEERLKEHSRGHRDRRRATAGHARSVRGAAGVAGDARPSTGDGTARSRAAKSTSPASSRTRSNPPFSALSACGCCGPITRPHRRNC